MASTAAPMATDGDKPVAAAAAASLLEPPSSCHNYVVTAQRPTAVTHAVVGSFTAPGSVDLVLARATRLEVYTLTGEGLQVRQRQRERERHTRARSAAAARRVKTQKTLPTRTPFPMIAVKTNHRASSTHRSTAASPSWSCSARG
jgi:hypothetical protein